MNVRFHLHLLLPITLFTLIFSCNAQHPSEKEKEALTALIASDAYPNIDGVLVAQNGTLLYEAYFNGFGRDSLHDTRSAFKSITSMLAGIAIEKGMLSRSLFQAYLLQQYRFFKANSRCKTGGENQLALGD